MAASSSSCTAHPSEDVSTEGPLFHPPRDLICPITQNLFADPVVNSVGQIYERQAFLAYLANSQEKTDPVTRQSLDENVVTSIYAVKARASDYREETARKCVGLAAQTDATASLTYLKRAAELCSETDIQVPGLGRETMGRIQRQAKHPGYATVILMSFAEDLMKEGMRDEAAAVYYAVLKAGDGDMSMQPDLLKCCIDCWAGRFCEGQDDAAALEKLLDFVVHQRAFSWGEVIDIMEHASMDTHLILSLCEGLLTREHDNPGLWKMEKAVMLKYIQLRCRKLQETQSAIAQDVQLLKEWKERTSRSGVYRSTPRLPFSVLKERRKRFFLKKRFVPSLLLGALELMNGGRFFKRLLKATAILVVINSC